MRSPSASSVIPAKALGRPRAFSPEAALDAATRVFRRSGYEGASLNDLTAAMGINRPSCYAAFGDKEALFRRVLERYTEGISSFYRTAFAQPTARAVAAYLLQETIMLATSGEMEEHCLLTLKVNPGDPLSEVLRTSRESLDRSLRSRFRRAQRTGDLPKDSSPAALAALLSITLRGLVSQAAEQVPRVSLLAQAETLLRLFPAKHLP